MKEHSPSAERNRHDILPLLREILPAKGTVLEIACGSGQHAIHFAAEFPGLSWQPSDIDSVALKSTSAYAAGAELPNLREPIELDVCSEDWPVAEVDAVLAINMLHISPWEACLGLMRGAGRSLVADGKLFLYGAYIQEGVPTKQSNLAFDADLRQRNPAWGLRRLEDVVAAAEEQSLRLREVRPMPNNNLSVIFERT
ncbi:MAG: DUF938 domain-containing protein [Planctomycetota bacterium]|jgi:cyclopropane fatty-acyl-phospholipid synthase-like methyltransferase